MATIRSELDQAREHVAAAAAFAESIEAVSLPRAAAAWAAEAGEEDLRWPSRRRRPTQLFDTRRAELATHRVYEEAVLAVDEPASADEFRHLRAEAERAWRAFNEAAHAAERGLKP